ELVDGVVDRCHALEQLGAELVDRFARFRQLGGPPRAIQQQQTERLLEGLDLLAHRRLGAKQVPAGTSKPAVLDHGAEAAYVVAVDHVRHYKQRLSALRDNRVIATSRRRYSEYRHLPVSATGLCGSPRLSRSRSPSRGSEEPPRQQARGGEAAVFEAI